ncbi:MAG: hypothetical protein IJW05_00250 [Lentisphaeria bacterium]|nr:hypothetical protein [Lentisphaeria bacterium]
MKKSFTTFELFLNRKIKQGKMNMKKLLFIAVCVFTCTFLYGYADDYARSVDGLVIKRVPNLDGNYDFVIRKPKDPMPTLPKLPSSGGSSLSAEQKLAAAAVILIVVGVSKICEALSD